MYYTVLIPSDSTLFMCHSTTKPDSARGLWPQYLGKYSFHGETRNGAPVYVKDIPIPWKGDGSSLLPPPTLSRNSDGRWYVQDPKETETKGMNGGNIFRCKIPNV